jgi:hypothetical protein
MPWRKRIKTTDHAISLTPSFGTLPALRALLFAMFLSQLILPLHSLTHTHTHKRKTKFPHDVERGPSGMPENFGLGDCFNLFAPE